MTKKKRFRPLEWLEDHIRYACGSLSHDARILITILMILTTSGLSIYFTIHSIYSWGKNKGERISIQQIEQLRLELKNKELEMDSINQLKTYDYDRYERYERGFGE